MGVLKKNSNVQTGISLVLLSSLIFAFVPNFAKLALDSDASLFFLLFSRFVIGTFILIPILCWRNQRLLDLTKDQLFRLIIAGSFAFVLIALTYHAIEFLDVGIVMVVLYCFPLGVALVLQTCGKQRLSRKSWSFMFSAFLGLIVLLSGKGFDLSIYGLSISLIAMFCFVAFIVSASSISNEIGAVRFNFFVSLYGLLLLIIAYASPLELVLSLSNGLKGHLAILGNGVFYIFSWVIFFESSKLIGAARTSVLSCSEPLFAAILAIPLLGQNLSTIEWIGFFIVLISLIMFSRSSVL